MTNVSVFEPPMCCSTGVCGPEPDPELARFSSDLVRLGSAGVNVTRHNLAQEPKAFVDNAAILTTLREAGSDALPIVTVDERIVSKGRYPSYQELAGWAGIAASRAGA